MEKVDHYQPLRGFEKQTDSEKQSDNALDTIHSRHVDRIWERMVDIYGHKWTSSHSDSDASGTWLKGLQGLTPDQLATGLTKCLTRTDAWPPSLPEYRALCLPSAEDLGLPDAREAYMMAVNSNWEHPAILHAAQQVGTYELKTQAEAKTWPLFKKAYNLTVQKVVSGEFEEPEKINEQIEKEHIPNKKPVIDKEAILANLQKMRDAI